MPRHGVGVPGRGGHHDPYVGGADELGGQDPVPYDERVDVGGVQEGQPPGEGRGGLHPQHGVVPLAVGAEVVEPVRVRDLPRRQPHAGELREHPHPGEPVVVVRVADEYGRARRRAQHTGLTDPAPHQRIDERRLARAGGSPDDREQRRLGILEPGYEVVVELGEEFGPRLPGARGARQRKWKTHGSDTVAQGGKCVDELGPYVHGYHM